MTTPEFIFMLTRDDRTVADAHRLLAQAVAAGVGHIGFKDVGLPTEQLSTLARSIREAGLRCYLEIVSLDAESERASAEIAVALKVDVLMGGTRPECVLPVIAGSGIAYYPFAGHVVGHPGRLTGTVAEIVESARRLVAIEGVAGVDLLAYRFDGDVSALLDAVCGAVGGDRLVVAGSIDRDERIAAVAKVGATLITVGTAALDARFAAPPTLRDQLGYVQTALARWRKEQTMPQKINLFEAFATFAEHWSPRIVGDVNAAQVKLAKFSGAFHWHHHEVEDELFLVVAGRLRMGFRDRDVDLEPGEFIVVPHGTEHRPEALDGECHVLLLEPNTTLNTGNVENERTVRELQRIA